MDLAEPNDNEKQLSQLRFTLKLLDILEKSETEFTIAKAFMLEYTDSLLKRDPQSANMPNIFYQLFLSTLSDAKMIKDAEIIQMF